MNIASISLSLIIALIYGALYHLIRNGGFWRLMFYLLLSIVGFAAGNFISNWQDWQIITIGSIDAGAASAGSLIVLLVGDRLSRVNDKPQSTV